MSGLSVRDASTRVDVNKKLVYKELNTLDPEWKHNTLEELLQRYWEKNDRTVRWGNELGMDNPIKNMPIAVKRSTHIIFKIYPQQSPDRNLQLAIALVKSICKDYDKQADIMEVGESACPRQICETEPCTIIAREILSYFYS